jgi:hypothetical protein
MSSDTECTPEQTLAVLLGASWFEHARQLAQGPPFANSAQDFREYLLSEKGLRLPRENLQWLFDDSRSPSDQLTAIGDFLLRRTGELSDQGMPPQNLILYYVGHGLFCGGDHAYHLAIRATDDQREGLTSLRFSELASVIKDRARFMRRFLILDSCFSATAYREFQSGPLQAGLEKVRSELPARGTTLLCSASAQEASRAPKELGYTMFSSSLLQALRLGHETLGVRMSLSELGDLLKLDLRTAYPRDWVRPEIHSPDQREGNIADVALFPNPAYRTAESESLQSQGDRVSELPRREADRALGGGESQRPSAQAGADAPQRPQAQAAGSVASPWGQPQAAGWGTSRGAQPPGDSNSTRPAQPSAVGSDPTRSQSPRRPDAVASAPREGSGSGPTAGESRGGGKKRRWWKRLRLVGVVALLIWIVVAALNQPREDSWRSQQPLLIEGSNGSTSADPRNTPPSTTPHSAPKDQKNSSFLQHLLEHAGHPRP